MALRDAACYTLNIIPSLHNPNLVELTEEAQPEQRSVAESHSYGTEEVAVRKEVKKEKPREPKYVRVRESKDGEAYSGVIYDAFSGAKLGSMGYSNAKDKKRRLELHGPDEVVSFEFTGKFGFEWTFVFEGNKYKWSKELYGKDYICSLDRKPDPRVEICLARDSDKDGPGRMQILHYNIDRFPNDIKDLRGLETLLVASLMCILDALDERSAVRPVAAPAASTSTTTAPTAPSPPPRQISEEDFEPDNPNEIVVGLQTNVDDHIARAVGLLEDPKVVFVVIRTRNPGAVQRALEVSLGVTRFRHREGLGEIKQYVVDEESTPPSTAGPVASGSSKPGPKVISLDDPDPSVDSRPSSSSNAPAKPSSWSAPNISIYLSKIDLPDLKPGRRETMKANSKVQAGGPPIVTSSSAPPRPAPPKAGSASTSFKVVDPRSRRKSSSAATPAPATLQPGSLPPRKASSPNLAHVPPRPSSTSPRPPPAPAQATPGIQSSGFGGGVNAPPAKSDSATKTISLGRMFKAAASKV